MGRVSEQIYGWTNNTALHWNDPPPYKTSSWQYKPWPESQLDTINLAQKLFKPFTIIETSRPFYILDYLRNLIFWTACFRLASPLESLGKRMRDGYGRSFGSWPWQNSSVSLGSGDQSSVPGVWPALRQCSICTRGAGVLIVMHFTALTFY